MRSWQKYYYLCLFLFIILPIWGVRSALAQATVEATPPTAELLYPNLTGAFIELTAEPMHPNLWTRLQWQDASGNWHDIEGWQGSFNPDQRVLWYIGSEQLGDGPFRWLVDESQGGEQLGMSQPFYLPSHGGELLHITVSLTPEKTEEAVTMPSTTDPAPDGAVGIPPTATPAPDETALPEESYFYDGFDDPTYDGAYNSTLWPRANGCEDAAQSDGVIVFQNSCDLFVGSAPVPVEQLGTFQARVKVASDFEGVAATQEIIFSTELSTGLWWAYCGIIATADGVQKFFNVVNVGLDETNLHQTLPAEYDRWYTIRLEVDSSTMTFSCYIDEQLIGSVVPTEAEELREVHFERILEAARQPDSFATTYVEYVRLVNSSQNDETLSGDGPSSGLSSVRDGTSWIVNPSNKHAYRLIECGSWIMCESQAAAQGAYLVTINDQMEQTWLLRTFGANRWFWIGLTDQDSEGNWQWSNGEAITYTNWASGEPNDSWECGEDFAHMNMDWAPAGKWNDLGPCLPEWELVTWAVIESPS